MKNLIKGYEQVEKLYGYFPTFHDDIIEKIEISKDNVTIYIAPEIKPEKIKEDFRIKLILEGVENIEFEGDIYGVVAIIFQLEFKSKENFIETTINSLLGISGFIKSKSIILSILENK